MITQNKTVAAISTPPGKGGVALIRISGDDALKVASKVFRAASGKEVDTLPSRYSAYGKIIGDGKAIDDGIITLYRAPASFTGEDTAEICCHGGSLVTRRVLEACFLAGAYPAPAGEFTRRAYINGKLTLSESEAIGDLLDAKTDSQLSLARNGLSGKLSSEIKRIYAEMTRLVSSVYVLVDYPEEDLAPLSESELSDSLSALSDDLGRLCSGYRTAEVIHDGIRTVICGAANTGKSSLYNALCGSERAIVTDIEGTTRDTLTSEVALGDILLCLSDTAGLRESEDTVEKIGIERSRKAIEDAELVLCVFDTSRALSDEDRAVLEILSAYPEKCKIALLNKSDLEERCETELILKTFEHTLSISAKLGEGTDKLAALVRELFITEKIDIEKDAILQNARQYANARAALSAIDDARAAIAGGLPADMAACDIERAMQAIGEIDGQSVSEDVVANIFSKFCVGK